MLNQRRLIPMTRWLKVRWVGVFVPILLSLAAHAGAVTWEGEASQFRYAVENNGGTFVHLPSLYLSFNDVSSVKSYDPGAGEFDNLSDRPSRR
jgi:hypothetical protein